MSWSRLLQPRQSNSNDGRRMLPPSASPAAARSRLAIAALAAMLLLACCVALRASAGSRPSLAWLDPKAVACRAIDRLRCTPGDGAEPGAAVLPDWLLGAANKTDRAGQALLQHLLVSFDDIEFGKRIGHGSCGKIFQARWKGALVAVKLPNPDMGQEEYEEEEAEQQQQQQDAAGEAGGGCPVEGDPGAWAEEGWGGACPAQEAGADEGSLSGSCSAAGPASWAQTPLADVSCPAAASRPAHEAGAAPRRSRSHSMGSSRSGWRSNSYAAQASALSNNTRHELQLEIALLASLRHPHLISMYGICFDTPCIILEYCARGSLSHLLERAEQEPELAAQLTWRRRLSLALDAALGLLHLHSLTPRPIIHRDFKSLNLLVGCSEPEGWTAKITDLSMSEVVKDRRSLQGSSISLNPRWLAPEGIAGQPLTPAADVYSLGIVLWELLTWQFPWYCWEEAWAGEEVCPLNASAVSSSDSYWSTLALEQAILAGLRPQVPPLRELPGPDTAAFAAAGGLDAYVALMEACWAQAPADRPTIAAIVPVLRALLDLAPPATSRATAGWSPAAVPWPQNACPAG